MGRLSIFYYPYKRPGRAACVVLLLALVCCVQPAAAQSVQTHLSADSVTVGERFFLSLVAEHAPQATPLFPAAGPADSLRFGDLEVIGQRAHTSYRRDNIRVDSVVYEVATFALDTARVPPVTLAFITETDTLTAASAPAFVPVISLVPPDAEDIRELAPLVLFPAPKWPWVLLTLTLLTVIALLAYYTWKRRGARGPEQGRMPAPPVRPPYEEALERLKALEQAELHRPGALKPFYVELSELLRRYLSRRLQVNALEHTTGELIHDLEHTSILPAESIHRIRTVLELADFVKFADIRPSDERSRAALEEAASILQTVERSLHRPPEPRAPAGGRQEKAHT